MHVNDVANSRKACHANGEEKQINFPISFPQKVAINVLLGLMYLFFLTCGPINITRKTNFKFRNCIFGFRCKDALPPQMGLQSINLQDLNRKAILRTHFRQAMGEK